MCGRYYVDDETAREIEKIVRSVDEKLKKEATQSSKFQTKDIHPTESAPVIVAAAAGFYEWNKQKEKSTFTRKDSPVLYMAGIYTKYEDEDRFVILTTAANESMEPVHDRMPLILEENEILPWLTERSKTEVFLRKTPCRLNRSTEFEQITLF